MQDEPEVALGFSRKMSLKGKDGMLGVRVGRDNAPTDGVRELGQARQGAGAAIPLPDDGIEPGAGERA
jgi:hypothetical protein